MPSISRAVRARLARVRSVRRQAGAIGVMRWGLDTARRRLDERRRPSTPRPGPRIGQHAPQTTLVVPTRDDGRSVGILLRGFQDDAAADWECIVVDAASTDSTVDVAQQFASVDARFRIVCEDRIDREAAIETGVTLARGARHEVRDPRVFRSAPEPHERDPASASVDRPVTATARPREIAALPQELDVTATDLAGAMVLVAESPYHLEELVPLAGVLRDRGHQVEFMLPAVVRPAFARSLARAASAVLRHDPLLIEHAAALVVMNDWGAARPLVDHANDAGVATFAKVEGVQDFDDVDTGRIRRPYRSASVVLAQGANDVAALRGRRTVVVGSSRLERLRLGPPARLTDTALVNLNFTYGVLAGERDRWIASVREAIDRSSFRPLVSRHPADTGPVAGLPISDNPFRHDVRSAGVVVSRFSTVAFEAMALGVPFVYHNPHEERVPTFAAPRGAFSASTDADGLLAALVACVAADTAEQRRRTESFFLDQIDVDQSRRSEQRAADAIESIIRLERPCR